MRQRVVKQAWWVAGTKAIVVEGILSMFRIFFSAILKVDRYTKRVNLFTLMGSNLNHD
jgi:hypothetical protein